MCIRDRYGYQRIRSLLAAVAYQYLILADTPYNLSGISCCTCVHVIRSEMIATVEKKGRFAIAILQSVYIYSVYCYVCAVFPGNVCCVMK